MKKLLFLVLVLGLLFGAACSTNPESVTGEETPVPPQPEWDGELVDLGTINSVNVIRLIDGNHICYIVTSAKWNNVPSDLECVS